MVTVHNTPQQPSPRAVCVLKTRDTNELLWLPLVDGQDRRRHHRAQRPQRRHAAFRQPARSRGRSRLRLPAARTRRGHRVPRDARRPQDRGPSRRARPRPGRVRGCDRRGQAGALAEEDRPGVFTTTVGNLAAGKEPSSNSSSSARSRSTRAKPPTGSRWWSRRAMSPARRTSSTRPASASPPTPTPPRTRAG